MPQDCCNVLLVDRDPLARRAMRDGLEATGRVRIVGEATDGASALAAVREQQPDVVLIDAGFPAPRGIAVAQELLEQLPATRIVFCAIDPDEDTALRCLIAGAVGYLAKDLAPAAVARALVCAGGGELAISRTMSARLLGELRRTRLGRAARNSAGTELTGREWQVLDLLIDGRDTVEIAAELGLARETVRSHVKGLLRKLGVSSRAEAVEVATTRRRDALARRATV
jgi:DNA-binding NarL/FixJ family response regulator